jgi:hypothetical protein
MNTSDTVKVQPKRKWSVVRKAQVVSGSIGAIATIVFTMNNSMLNKWLINNREASNNAFKLAMDFVTPTILLCKALGLSYGHTWLWPVVIIVNTLLFIGLGTLMGFLINIARKRIFWWRNHEH